MAGAGHLHPGRHSVHRHGRAGTADRRAYPFRIQDARCHQGTSGSRRRTRLPSDVQQHQQVRSWARRQLRNRTSLRADWLRYPDRDRPALQTAAGRQTDASPLGPSTGLRHAPPGCRSGQRPTHRRTAQPPARPVRRPDTRRHHRIAAPRSQPTHSAASRSARASGSAEGRSRETWRATRAVPRRTGSTRPTRRPPRDGRAPAGAQYQSSDILATAPTPKPTSAIAAPVQNSHQVGWGTIPAPPTMKPMVMIVTATHETGRPWNVS